MKKAAVSRHTCSTLSAQQDLPASFICLSVYPFIYPPIFLSVYFLSFSHSYPSIHPIPSVSQWLHLSFYLFINHNTRTQRYKQDIYSFKLARLLLVMHLRFIYFLGTNMCLKTENLIKWLPWLERMVVCVCVCVSPLKIGLWRAVAKWIMLKQIFILLGYCPVFGSIKPSAFRAIKNKTVIRVGGQRKRWNKIEKMDKTQLKIIVWFTIDI